MHKTLPTLFWTVLLAELLFRGLGVEVMDLILKPLLMPILAAWYAYGVTKNKASLVVMLALLFSWVGDIVLMIDGYFVFGLAAFLVAHLCYVYVFYKSSSGYILKMPWLILPFVALAAGFLWLAHPNLGSLLTPVAVYIVAIMCMVIMAINRRGGVGTTSYDWVLVGGILFMISDLMIGIHKFVAPLPLEGVWVMGTYGAAQFLIIGGMQDESPVERLMNNPA